MQDKHCYCRSLSKVNWIAIQNSRSNDDPERGFVCTSLLCCKCHYLNTHGWVYVHSSPVPIRKYIWSNSSLVRIIYALHFLVSGAIFKVSNCLHPFHCCSSLSSLMAPQGTIMASWMQLPPHTLISHLVMETEVTVQTRNVNVQPHWNISVWKRDSLNFNDSL